MKWTAARPTEPGWYWCKHRLPDRTPAIAYLYLSNESVTDKPVLSVCFGDSECWLHEECFNGWQWAGPIPTPEEP